MEEYIRIIEDLICEFHQSGEKERYEQAKALEVFLSLLGEIDCKEASDALYMLLYCALINKDFETQKQQFQIVNAYIKQLEEENKKLKKVKSDELIINNPWLFEYLNESYIFKGKVKEKIEEINNENLNYSENEYYLESEIKGYAMEHLQELLRKE